MLCFVVVVEDVGLLYLFGVMMFLEVLLVLEYGYCLLKLFLVDGIVSVKMLKSLKGLFIGICFCLIGGVNLDNLLNFFCLFNVVCVGGIWLVLLSLIWVWVWD